MNLPNKITVTRIILSIFTLIFLVLPWYQFGVSFPMYTFMGKVVVNSKYVIAGVLFVLASLTDFLDGYIARSKNLVTDFGKVMDAIADKILVNGVLIILAYNGFINIAIPIIIIVRDTFVDSIKMVSGNNGKVVAASILADILIIAACLLSVISGCEYYFNAKEFLFKEM